MNFTEEQLTAIIRKVVKEELEAFFNSKPDQDQASYQSSFDETMAKVARGEIDAEEAGKMISKAYQEHVSPSKNVATLTAQFENFKKQLVSWEEELEPIFGKGESPEELLTRMKSKVDAKEKELKEALDLKKLNEESAKAKAETELQKMKDALKK